jgi:hypothetical protein
LRRGEQRGAAPAGVSLGEVGVDHKFPLLLGRCLVAPVVGHLGQRIRVWSVAVLHLHSLVYLHGREPDMLLDAAKVLLHVPVGPLRR